MANILKWTSVVCLESNFCVSLVLCILILVSRSIAVQKLCSVFSAYYYLRDMRRGKTKFQTKIKNSFIFVLIQFYISWFNPFSNVTFILKALSLLTKSVTYCDDVLSHINVDICFYLKVQNGLLHGCYDKRPSIYLSSRQDVKLRQLLNGPYFLSHGLIVSMSSISVPFCFILWCIWWIYCMVKPV